MPIFLGAELHTLVKNFKTDRCLGMKIRNEVLAKLTVFHLVA
jgi:hypothetical protein